MTRATAVAIADSSVSPGVLGFLVVAALGVATWLLVRSMQRQIRKIDFDEDAERPAADPAEGAAATLSEPGADQDPPAPT